VNTVKQSLSAVLPKGSLTNKANLLDLGAEIRLLADADGALYRAWRWMDVQDFQLIPHDLCASIEEEPACFAESEDLCDVHLV
jgi:hypothetical protein